MTPGPPDLNVAHHKPAANVELRWAGSLSGEPWDLRRHLPLLNIEIGGARGYRCAAKWQFNFRLRSCRGPCRCADTRRNTYANDGDDTVQNPLQDFLGSLMSESRTGAICKVVRGRAHRFAGARCARNHQPLELDDARSRRCLHVACSWATRGPHQIISNL